MVNNKESQTIEFPGVLNLFQASITFFIWSSLDKCGRSSDSSGFVKPRDSNGSTQENVIREYGDAVVEDIGFRSKTPWKYTGYA